MAICHYTRPLHPLQVAPKLCRIQEIFCFEGPDLPWLQLEEILLPEGIIRQLSWNSVLNRTFPLQWFSLGTWRVIPLWKHCAHLTVTDAGGSHVVLPVTVRSGNSEMRGEVRNCLIWKNSRFFFLSVKLRSRWVITAARCSAITRCKIMHFLSGMG